jgi:hypothetical protein
MMFLLKKRNYPNILKNFKSPAFSITKKSKNTSFNQPAFTSNFIKAYDYKKQILNKTIEMTIFNFNNISDKSKLDFSNI